ncbi:hypothetical protein C2W62_17975 [Candidatus Entotheonella serta]|nr:hypothetical protein C2W62_17975 [Candidatus Entotheonella serta]
MAVSFEDDIMPMFKKYQGQMRWRLDLANYDDVKTNAELIRARISLSPDNTNIMPPPPFDPLTQDDVALFCQWINEGVPR